VGTTVAHKPLLKLAQRHGFVIHLDMFRFDVAEERINFGVGFGGVA
jgi:hypothetical protein